MALPLPQLERLHWKRQKKIWALETKRAGGDGLTSGSAPALRSGFSSGPISGRATKNTTRCSPYGRSSGYRPQASSKTSLPFGQVYDREAWAEKVILAEKDFNTIQAKCMSLSKKIRKAKRVLHGLDLASEKLLGDIVARKGDVSGRLEALRILKILQRELYNREIKHESIVEKQRELVEEAKIATKKGMRNAEASILRATIRDYNRIFRLIRDNMCHSKEDLDRVLDMLESQKAQNEENLDALHDAKREILNQVDQARDQARASNEEKEAIDRRRRLQSEISLRKKMDQLRVQLNEEHKRETGQRAELFQEFSRAKGDSLALDRTAERIRQQGAGELTKLRRLIRARQMQIQASKDTIKRYSKAINDIAHIDPENSLDSTRAQSASRSLSLTNYAAYISPPASPSQLQTPTHPTSSPKDKSQRTFTWGGEVAALEDEVESLMMRRDLLLLVTDIQAEKRRRIMLRKKKIDEKRRAFAAGRAVSGTKRVDFNRLSTICGENILQNESTFESEPEEKDSRWILLIREAKQKAEIALQNDITDEENDLKRLESLNIESILTPRSPNTTVATSTLSPGNTSDAQAGSSLISPLSTATPKRTALESDRDGPRQVDLDDRGIKPQASTAFMFPDPDKEDGKRPSPDNPIDPPPDVNSNADLDSSRELQIPHTPSNNTYHANDGTNASEASVSEAYSDDDWGT